MSQLVSVIIPTYNREKFISLAVESVLTQTYTNFELIVVDDGSSDGTKEILKKYPIKVLEQKNAGPSAARNHGASVANGEMLSFLDSDDQWKPEKLARQMEAVQSYSDSKVFYTGETWIRKGVHVNACKHHQKYSGWIYEHCVPLCIISPSSVLMPKDLYLEEGGFDEALPAAEDYDLWLRLCSKVKAHYIEEELIIKTGGHDDQLSAMRGIDQYRVIALEKMMRKDDLKLEWKKLTHEDLLRRIKILIKGYEKYNKLDLVMQYKNKLEYWSGYF